MIQVQAMTTLYKPQPERWPQVSLKGLFVVLTLSALVAATYRERPRLVTTPSPIGVFELNPGNTNGGFIGCWK